MLHCCSVVWEGQPPRGSREVSLCRRTYGGNWNTHSRWRGRTMQRRRHQFYVTPPYEEPPAHHENAEQEGSGGTHPVRHEETSQRSRPASTIFLAYSSSHTNYVWVPFALSPVSTGLAMRGELSILNFLIKSWPTWRQRGRSVMTQNRSCVTVPVPPNFFIPPLSDIV